MATTPIVVAGFMGRKARENGKMRVSPFYEVKAANAEGKGEDVTPQLDAEWYKGWDEADTELAKPKE